MIDGTCGSCHLVPQPTDLPQGIWDTVVFPRMGQFLGRYGTPTEREELLGSNPMTRQQLEKAQTYPSEPLVSDQDWAAIRAYYLRLAPAAAPLSKLVPHEETKLFRPRYPNVFLSPPSTTFVRITPAGILAADVNKEVLLRCNADLEPVAQLPIGKGLTDLSGLQLNDFATVIGSFSPTEAGTGQLLEIGPAGPQVVANGLQRPTSLARLDTDGDGTDEVLVTEYGKWTGRLSLWRQASNGWESSTIAPRSGAIKVITDTSTTVPTAYVLYGQGKEAIVRYTFADGKPSGETVLEFPPSYGSSSLQLLDWNGDAYPDLLYTNGDNADYVSPVKDYHGIRIFTGAADGSFVEEIFLSLPGAYGAQVADFDGNGHLDIAAISFFPDYTATQPIGAALYLGAGNGAFTLHPLPATDRGRYLTLSAGDLEGDGDLDLVAGTLALQAVPDGGRMERWLKEGLPFVVWENTSK